MISNNHYLVRASATVRELVEANVPQATRELADAMSMEASGVRRMTYQEQREMDRIIRRACLHIQKIRLTKKVNAEGIGPRW